MIWIVIAQLIRIGANLLNARLDANQILKHKPVAHGRNAIIAVVVWGLTAWMAGTTGWWLIADAAGALCCRQLFFDIPLNLWRGLKWDYVSSALKIPVWDRIENKLIRPGRRLHGPVYAVIYVLTLVFLLIYH